MPDPDMPGLTSEPLTVLHPVKFAGGTGKLPKMAAKLQFKIPGCEGMQMDHIAKGKTVPETILSDEVRQIIANLSLVA